MKTSNLLSTFIINATASCSLPPDKGPCYGNIPRYFYNTTGAKCEVFSYGGCFPNKNNFLTQHECESHCKCEFGSLLLIILFFFIVVCPPTCTPAFCKENIGAMCSL